MTEVGPTRRWQTRIAISPAREVFGIAYNALSGDPELYKIDTLTGNSTLLLSMHGLEVLKGLIAMGNGVFYTFEGPTAAEANKLIKIDVGTNSITDEGNLFPKAIGDPCFFEGEIYYPSVFLPPFFIRHISKLNLEEPNQSKPVAYVSFDFRITGVCASNICNTLIGVDTLNVDELVYINLKDGDWASGTGSAVAVCSKTDGLSALTSVQELKSPAICNLLDLDCNNSSMAIGSDYNADTIDCHHSKVKIVDKDVLAYTDTIIKEMRIELKGYIPDGASEYLEITGDIYTIEESGDGTHIVKLKNGGPATFPDFNYMLQRIFYNNDATYPTGGTRTIEIKFITEFGTESEIATAFIPVVALPLYPVELGDSLVKCQGESIELEAYTPGAHYLWSTGSIQSSIYVNNPGYYSVQLTGVDKCPNGDTVWVSQLQVVHVGLGGDNIFCGDEQPELHFIINSSADLYISILTSEDTTLYFNELNNSENIEVEVPLGAEILYTISNVTSNPEACIEINNDETLLGHFPSYEQIFHKAICEGDSIMIGYEYESEAGTYDRALYTEAGCDSNVTVELSLLPLSYTYSAHTNCDITQVGVFNTVLLAANGCDSIHQTTVTYAVSDTAYLYTPACKQADVGVSQTLYTNADGCDSLVITQSYYVPPSDSTLVWLTSCEEEDLGTFPELSVAADGCDSLTITTIVLAPTDTTYSFSSSCIPANVGVFESIVMGHDGCDSVIISTVSFSLSDTVYTESKSCDPSSLGVFEYHFAGTDGCDSTVVNTVTFSAFDSTFITSLSCDPAETGVFVNTYVNRFGCDSIVTQTISLLPASSVSITSTTCDPGMTGIFVYDLTNQYGCDSIVTETVSLLPTSETFLSSSTCRSAEAGVFVQNLTAHNGCDSIVTTTVSLIPADTTRLFSNTCDPEKAGNIQILYPGQDGCDSLVISTIDLFSLPEVDIAPSDYNGYGISCFGENDGSLSATATGTGPFNYEWSTGS
ncbi:MAG TPA: SprB repeat-containing protein, partial [Saprospiraceae bacterium]|nr:SprB repeat-containing protein [Saprospiraceae bacterium]